MTGESKPQRKNTAEMLGSGEPGAQSYPNMAYMGCLVLSGTGRGLVTAVGESSQFGEMVKLLSNEEPPRTPLQDSDKSIKLKTFTELSKLYRIWF